MKGPAMCYLSHRTVSMSKQLRFFADVGLLMVLRKCKMHALTHTLILNSPYTQKVTQYRLVPASVLVGWQLPS